jgi:hypothetical protein
MLRHPDGTRALSLWCKIIDFLAFSVLMIRPYQRSFPIVRTDYHPTQQQYHLWFKLHKYSRIDIRCTSIFYSIVMVQEIAAEENHL